MEKFMLLKSPKVYDWNNEEETYELFTDEYDMKEIVADFGLPDAVFYWYVSGSYEGSGALLAIKDGKWFDKELGHCSCYGPLDSFAKSIKEYVHESLDSFIEKCTDDNKKAYMPLVELAKSKGYK